MKHQRNGSFIVLNRSLIFRLFIMMIIMIAPCLSGIQATGKGTAASGILSQSQVTELSEKLRSEDPAVVSSALEEVKKCKDKRFLPLLLEIHSKYTSNEPVSEEADRLRETIQVQIIQSLVGIGNRSALPLLQEGFAGETNGVTKAFYAWARVQFNDQEGVAHLLYAMADTGEPDRQNAAALIRPVASNFLEMLIQNRKLTPKHILSYVEKLEEIRTREFEGVIKLVKGGGNYDVVAIAEDINTRFGDSEEVAFDALVKLGSRSVRPLIQALSNPSLKRNVLMIAYSLVLIKDRSAIEPLIMTLENSVKEDVRIDLAKYLKKLTGMGFGTNVSAWKKWLKTQKTPPK